MVDYKQDTIPNDIPDGMTIDANGNLWVANFASQKVSFRIFLSKKHSGIHDLFK